MICNACKENIEILELEIGDAFIDISPLSFRKGYYHSFCFNLLLDESKETQSKNINYQSRYDEYCTKKC